MNITRFTLRLPAELHKRLVEIARSENRSLHAQIVHFLLEAIKQSVDEKKEGK